MRMLPFFFALLITGCASNGISVSETTPDNGTFSMSQRTISTWGSRTEEGAGSMAYTAKSQDGSSFDLRAGAGVIGQQAGDPSQLLMGILQAVAPLISQNIESKDGRAIVEEQADAAKLDRILEAIERLSMQSAPTR